MNEENRGNKPETALARTDDNQLASTTYTARQIIDTLMQGAGGFVSELHGGNCMHVPLNNLDASTELMDAARALRPVINELFGENNKVTWGNGLSGHISLNIPLDHLEHLDEAQCQKLLEAISPVVQLSIRKGEELKAMQELLGSKFEIDRTNMNEERTHYAERGVPVFEIEQRIWRKHDEEPDAIIDPLSNDFDEKAQRLRDKTYKNTLKHLPATLNQALGEDGLFQGTWVNGRIVLTMREDDFAKVMQHPNLDKLRAIFRDPLGHCEHYRDTCTVAGRLKAAATGKRAELPASMRETPALPAAADETPAADAHNDTPTTTWRDTVNKAEKAARKGFGGDENETGMGYGI